MTEEGVWKRMSGWGDDSSVFVPYGRVIGPFTQVMASLKRLSCREDNKPTKRSIGELEKYPGQTDWIVG